MRGRRPILGNGEALTSAVERKYGGNAAPPPKTYDQARHDLFQYIDLLKEQYVEIPPELRFGDEFFYCLRVHPEALAKSFDMSSFIGNVSGIERIGTRAWNVESTQITHTDRLKNKIKKGQNEFVGKTIFIRSHVSALDRMKALLDESQTNLPMSFMADVCRLENLDLLKSDERVMGFTDDWKTGKVEIVLHPSRDNQLNLVEHFKALLDASGEDAGTVKSRVYPSNLAFISLDATKTILDVIDDYNPMRAIRPLEMSSFPVVRDIGDSAISAPLPPEISEKSSIKVGIFDGGIKVDHPLLSPYSNESSNLSVSSAPEIQAVAHGTAVAGAVLYGSLNQHKQGESLPAPNVSVESFRVFPLEDALDIDLYEAIDLIEEVVPARSDIDVYNLSFGPRGPILDDNISRFSYSLDNLAHMHNVLFVVACGNDGDCASPNDRIQSPADMVNGLGVGAHADNEKAPYSCCGPGREGAKTKPDVLAFGGTDNNPIHLLSVDQNRRLLSQGTSFSAPIVSGIAAQLIGMADRVSPLLARSLIIHNANHPDGLRCFDYGYGCICDDVDTYLNCSEKTATILYQGAIDPTRNIKLPIPIPEAVELSGLVTLQWTIAIESAVNDLDTLEYTSHCIEESFHPNSDVYRFTDPISQKGRYVNIVEDQELARKLADEGWGISSLPKSDSGGHKGTEETLRKKNLKWDTIIRNSVRKQAKSLHNPMLVLHAMSRNGVMDQVRFGAVVSISAPSYSGDIYNDIATHIPQLVPVRVRSENEIRIRN